MEYIKDISKFLDEDIVPFCKSIKKEKTQEERNHLIVSNQRFYQMLFYRNVKQIFMIQDRCPKLEKVLFIFEVKNA